MQAPSDLGNLVRARREALGLSQQQLASLSGLSRATINQIENGTLVDLGVSKVADLMDLVGLRLGLDCKAHGQPTEKAAARAMATGARDDVIWSLEWAWEIRVAELGISVFEVPARHVKGRKRSRLLVCNSVAQSVIESVRDQGRHRLLERAWRR